MTSTRSPRTGSTHDVVVVGASAAGAASAMLLARRGMHTLLIDHRRPGSETLPVRPLTRGGMAQLARWGLRDAVAAAGAPPVTRTTFRYGDEKVVVTVKASHGVDALYAPSAVVLDTLLLEAAIVAGAEVQRDVEAVHVAPRDNGVACVTVNASDDRVTEFVSALVVGADGVCSSVAQQIGAPITRTGAPAGAVTHGLWSELATDGYEWIFAPNARAGVIPTHDGQAVVFATGSPEIAGRDGAAFIRDVISAGAPEVGDRLRQARQPKSTHTWAGHRAYIRRSVGPGWALVGDAGCFKDPTSPHGFGDSLRDAELLARTIGGGLPDSTPSLDTLDLYQARRDRIGGRVFDVVDRIAGHRWDEAQIAHLLLQLSSAVASEIEAMEALTQGDAR
jgi:2-polyprenyl-6-methoxyphenol hydroxylase-like FAD-dependent oxidoreductase